MSQPVQWGCNGFTQPQRRDGQPHTHLGNELKRRHEEVVADHSKAQKAEQDDQEVHHGFAGPALVAIALRAAAESSAVRALLPLEAVAAHVRQERHGDNKVGDEQAHCPEQLLPASRAGSASVHRPLHERTHRSHAWDIAPAAVTQRDSNTARMESPKPPW